VEVEEEESLLDTGLFPLCINAYMQIIQRENKQMINVLYAM
jgi:hypothetical protein